MTARPSLPETMSPAAESSPVRRVAEPPLAPPGATRRSIRLRHDVVSYLEWPSDGAAQGVSAAPRTALLLHGLQSTALTMARIADGLAARGWRVIAPDLPGHGHTYAIDGSDAERPGSLDVSRLAILRHRLSRRHRLASTAALLVELAGRLAIDRPAVVGHSWGASVAATAASAGLMPAVLVLLDPPFVTAREARELGMRAMAEPSTSYEAARDTLLDERPDWDPMDLAAKAEAIMRVSTWAMVGVVASNVPFDPLPAVRRFQRRHGEVPVFVIMGEPGHGSFVSLPGQAALAALVGSDHVLVMDGAGHSPHRTHHDEFMTLLLGALDAAVQPAPLQTPSRA
jgi:pimeloyl-ACP methyl ester carboxylesterase